MHDLDLNLPRWGPPLVSVFRMGDGYLVLDSFWTCFGVRFRFGSNLDLDWSRLAPSLHVFDPVEWSYHEILLINQMINTSFSPIVCNNTKIYKR